MRAYKKRISHCELRACFLSQVFAYVSCSSSKKIVMVLVILLENTVLVAEASTWLL